MPSLFHAQAPSVISPSPPTRIPPVALPRAYETATIPFAEAGEWKSWRGDTHGSGVAAEAETVLSFSEEQNLLWKVHLPGPGNSTPIITNDQLLVTCGIGGNDAVVSYDLEGKELWRTSFGSETPGKGDNKQKGTGANSSIVTDGRGIFAYFKSGRVAALTMKGKKVWELNLQDKFGEDTLWWDEGTSPVIAGGFLVLAVMQTEGGSYVIGLQKTTGKIAWKVDRNFDVGAESGDSYTCLLYTSPSPRDRQKSRMPSSA